MSLKVNLTPLNGFKSNSPLCSLLEIENLKILIDCGWDFSFSDENVSSLKKIGKIDCVLLSHSSIQHIGALPFAISKLNLACPIYATLPTLKMGLMTLYDAFQDIESRDAEFTKFSIQDVDLAFSSVQTLKYFEVIPFADSPNISFKAMNSGNVLGGTIWDICVEGNSFVYAVDFNHRLERHLDCASLEILDSPTAVISSGNVFQTIHVPRNEIDKKIITSVMETLYKGADVLFPVDASGRSIELLFLLHSHWTHNRLSPKFSLVFLSHTVKHVIRFMNSMLEWTNRKCNDIFNATNKSPFIFQNLRVCSSLEDLASIPGPRVIMATNLTLENSFSFSLFDKMCSSSANKIIFTQKSAIPSDSLAAKCIKSCSSGGRRMDSVNVCVLEKVFLKGEELAEYLQFNKASGLPLSTTTSSGNLNNNRIRKDNEKNVSASNKVVIIEDGFEFEKKKSKRKIESRTEVQLFPMFNLIETNCEYDAYGEINSDFLIRPKSLHKSKKSFWKKTKSQKGQKNCNQVSKNKKPMKTAQTRRNLQPKCAMEYIDFEGRVDGISLVNIAQRIRPRKLVLLQCNEEDSVATGKAFGSEIQVLKFKVSRAMDLSLKSDSKEFSIALGFFNSLKTLNFSARNFEAQVTKVVANVSGQSAVSGLLVLDKNNANSSCASSKEEQFWNRNVFVGEVKLMDLAQALQERKIKCDITDGILYTAFEDGKARCEVRKVTPTDFSIDGVFCEEYFNVRSLLQKQFKIFA